MIVLWLTVGTCPVTDLEKRLLMKYDPKAVYPGSFITYNLQKFFKIKATDRQVDRVGYIIVAVLVLCVAKQYLFPLFF